MRRIHSYVEFYISPNSEIDKGIRLLFIPYRTYEFRGKSYMFHDNIIDQHSNYCMYFYSPTVSTSLLLANKIRKKLTINVTSYGIYFHGNTNVCYCPRCLTVHAEQCTIKENAPINEIIAKVLIVTKNENLI